MNKFVAHLRHKNIFKELPMGRSFYSFTDFEIERKLAKYQDHALMKLDRMVDWCAFDKVLSKSDSRNIHPSGRDCYNPATMFRIFILQKYYNLPDRDIED